MSRSQINLIPQVTEDQVKATGVKRKYTKLSYFILGLTLLCLISFYLFQTYLSVTLSRTVALSEAQSQKLQELSASESILKGIEVKLAKYNEVVSKYPKFPEIVAKISNKSSDLVSIDKMVVSHEGQMEISVSTSDKERLQRFLTDFQAQAESLNLTDVRILELEAIPAQNYRALLKFGWKT